MSTYKIGVIGGTGPQGRGLAFRFAHAGHRVVIGSRSAERADHTALEIGRRLDQADLVTGADNETAAASGDVVLLTIPYAGQAALIGSLRPSARGKVVISCVNPLGFDDNGAHGVEVPDGSAAEEAQQIMPDARVVSTFHHLSAVNLWKHCEPLSHEDILLCGDNHEAKIVVGELARSVTGRSGIDVGTLRHARHLESLTAALININKQFKIKSGVRIAGLPET